MIRLVNNFLKAIRLKDTLLLVSSSAAGQVISYLFLPLLGRLFTPVEFNDFAIIYAFIIPLSILSTFKIELAIPQCQSIEEKYHTTRLALFSVITQSFFIFIIVLSLHLFNGLSLQWLFLPIGVISFSFPQVLNVLLSSIHLYAQSSWYRIINNLALQIASAILGYWGWGSLGLILGFIIGQFAGIFILLKGQWQGIFSKSLLKISLHDFRNYIPYIQFSTPQGIMETLQLSGTIAILGYLFGDPIPGAYYLAWRILQAPITMISNTVFVIQYNECSQLKNQQLPYRQKLIGLFIALLLGGILMGSIFMQWGQQIFVWFLGETHFLSGEMSQKLAPWFVFQFCIAPFSFIALLENHQKKSFYLNSADVLLKFAGLWIGYTLGDLSIALWLYGLFSAAILAYSGFWYYRIAA